MTKNNKNDLRDKLEGDYLDLSMMNLTEVPVKEIAALPRAVKIDLSSNQLTSLPDNFASSLGHIVQLELGSNKLKTLPSNIQNLKNLKHLDLYNNQLTDLPLNLCQLKNLRWLDVKSNPLKPQLQKVAGDCLNKKECESAAKNVITYLKQVESGMQKEKQKKLKEERDREAAQKKKEDEVEAKAKAEKKAAKEKRKAESKAAQAKSGKSVSNGTTPMEEKSFVAEETKTKSENMSKGRWSTLAIVNIFLLLCILGASGVTLYVYTEGNLTQDSINKAIPRIQENALVLAALTKEAFQPENMKQTGLLMVQAVSDLASEAWTGLQVYTGDLSMYTEPVVEGLSSAWNWTYNTISTLEWNVIVAYVKSILKFIHEQWLVLCEQLGKNEAFMSALTALQKHTAGIREFLSIYLDMAAKQLTVAVEYIQLEGPVILSSVREQAAMVFEGAKQQIEALIK